MWTTEGVQGEERKGKRKGMNEYISDELGGELVFELQSCLLS